MLDTHLKNNNDGRDRKFINGIEILKSEMHRLSALDRLEAGRKIKELVKDHARTYLGEGSSRGFVSFVHGRDLRALSLKDGELYALSPNLATAEMLPLSHGEWFDSREEILEQIITLKYY